MEIEKIVLSKYGTRRGLLIDPTLMKAFFLLTTYFSDKLYTSILSPASDEAGGDDAWPASPPRASF